MEKVVLTPQDILNAVKIIDICVKRGAIEGNELTAVGAVRDKLESYANQELNIKNESVTDITR